MIDFSAHPLVETAWLAEHLADDGVCMWMLVPQHRLCYNLNRQYAFDCELYFLAPQS